MNTRIDIRKTPMKETQRCLRQIQSKDDEDKDTYLWLDVKDPRRHMTDNEIHESTIDQLIMN